MSRWTPATVRQGCLARPAQAAISGHRSRRLAVRAHPIESLRWRTSTRVVVPGPERPSTSALDQLQRPDGSRRGGGPRRVIYAPRVRVVVVGMHLRGHDHEVYEVSPRSWASTDSTTAGVYPAGSIPRSPFHRLGTPQTAPTRTPSPSRATSSRSANRSWTRPMWASTTRSAVMNAGHPDANNPATWSSGRGRSCIGSTVTEPGCIPDPVTGGVDHAAAGSATGFHAGQTAKRGPSTALAAIRVQAPARPFPGTVLLSVVSRSLETWPSALHLLEVTARPARVRRARRVVAGPRIGPTPTAHQLDTRSAAGGRPAPGRPAAGVTSSARRRVRVIHHH